MSDYAGALAAIRSRFLALWVDGSDLKTPITFPNEPPIGVDGIPTDYLAPDSPWVYFETLGDGSQLRGAGTLGDNVWLYNGHIFIHVFVPINTGIATAHELAVAAGEIFRAQSFYNDGQGCVVRCMSPYTDGGGTDDDNGGWFRLSTSITFEYFHRG